VASHLFSIAQQQAQSALDEALAHEEAGELPQAFNRFRAATQYDPGCGRAWRHLGNLFRRSGELAAASECFEKALASGDDRQLNEFFLSAVGIGAPVPRAPNHFVQALFNQYAHRFEAHLTSELKYCAPQLLHGLVSRDSPHHFARVLDLGCGTGLAARVFTTASGRVTGVDLSQEMLVRARESLLYEELVHASIEDYLATSVKSYDLILCCDALIYIGELSTLFTCVRRALAPGGSFAFTVESCEAESGFDLLPSLRYAHSERYIRQLAELSQLSVLGVARGTLREEDREAVQGLAFHLGGKSVEP